MLVLFTSLHNMILSIIIIVHAGVNSTNVCPHNGTYDFCIFDAIYLETGFVDIVPLCCKPSIFQFC